MPDAIQDFQRAAVTLGIVDGIGKMNQRRQNIKLQQAEQARKDKIFDLEKQKIEADLKIKTAEGEMNSILADSIRRRFGDKHKANKAVSQVMDTELQEEDMSLRQDVGKMMDVFDQITTTDRAGSIMPGMDVSFSKKVGPFTVKSRDKQKETVSSVQKTLGTLQSGGVSVDGFFEKFKKRDDAEAFARSNLGPNFEKRYPQAKQFIDSQFPDLVFIRLPDGRVGQIPKSNFKKALNAGAEQVNGN